MINAFDLGGDFHSRTAMTMYDYIQDDISKGGCRLEAEKYPEGYVPLLKDKYSSERKKAKILNFSLAYGKTVFGLAKDFNVSIEEAQITLDRWYYDRPEVKEWQLRMLELAQFQGSVPTLLGRRRILSDINCMDSKKRKHAMRAAINTPVQGSAADVANAAMMRIWRSEKLKDLNWKLILQVHDEVILEGPSINSSEARQEVIECMNYPFMREEVLRRGAPLVNPLQINLSVDTAIATNWFEAKNESVIDGPLYSRDY